MDGLPTTFLKKRVIFSTDFEIDQSFSEIGASIGLKYSIVIATKI